MFRRAANKSIINIPEEFTHIFGIKLASIWYRFWYLKLPVTLTYLNVCSLYSQSWKHSVYTRSTVELCIYRAPLDIFIIYPDIHLERVYFSVPTKARLWARCNIRWAVPSCAALHGFMEAITQISPRSVAGEVRECEDSHGVHMLWAPPRKPNNPFHLCVHAGPLGSRCQRELEVHVTYWGNCY